MTSIGLKQARAALTKRKGPPAEHDRPPVTPAPGPKRKPLPGRLDIHGNETPR